VYALDRTPWLLERCRAADIELRTCDLDDEQPPFDESMFDVVVFTDVLEHIFAPPSDVLRGVKRILRNDGKLILSVPNVAALDSRFRLLLGVNPSGNPDRKMQKGRVHGHGHLHQYTMREISALAEGVGFRIRQRRYLHQSAAAAVNVTPASTARRLLRLAYHTAHVLWPPFRMGILLECDVQ
jgi:SAM-dependent methyltransferase